MAPDRSAMERLREDLIRRARLERHGVDEQTVESTGPEMVEQTQTQTPTNRFQLSNLFSISLLGRSRRTEDTLADQLPRPLTQTRIGRYQDNADTDTIKTPDYVVLTAPVDMAPNELDLPAVARGCGDNEPLDDVTVHRHPAFSLSHEDETTRNIAEEIVTSILSPSTHYTNFQLPTPPAPTAAPSIPSRQRHHHHSIHTYEDLAISEPLISSPDPNEILLAQIIDERRRQRRGTDRHSRLPERIAEDARARRRMQAAERLARQLANPEMSEVESRTPRKFLFCFPWVRSRRMRSHILRCFVSGLFTISLIAVYLGLSVSGNINQGELTIILILIIVAGALFFIYSLLRLCMMAVVRGGSGSMSRRHGYLPQMPQPPHVIGPGGYVIPSRPIRVVMAQDEEAAVEMGGEVDDVVDESAKTKTKPPAYGRWRESVRVDPDRLFWQRSEMSATDSSTDRPNTTTGPRPPSYASDDGVSYVVEAAPRSTAPRQSQVEMQMPSLPLHPSELGRAAEGRPSW